MAILCAMLLAMSVIMAALGASAETASANTEQTEASDSDGEQNDQAEQDALTAEAQISQADAEKAFQALYPDWTIANATLEKEDNVPAYAIEATDANGSVLEVTISAVDGSVIAEHIGEQNGHADQNEGDLQTENAAVSTN